MVHQRHSDAPVPRHLAQPVVFWRTSCTGYFHEVVRILGPERRYPPVAGFAQLSFAAEIVQLENQLRVGSGRFCHSNLREDVPSLARLDMTTLMLWMTRLKLLPPVPRAQSHILYWDTQSPGQPSAFSPPDIHSRSSGISPP